MVDPSIGSSSPNWASLISNGLAPISESDVPASNTNVSNTTLVPAEAAQDLPLLMDSMHAGMSPYAPVFHPTGSYASHLLQLEQTAQSNPQLLPHPPQHPIDPNLEEYCDRSTMSDILHQKQNHMQSTGFSESNGNSCTVDLTIRVAPTCHNSYATQNMRGNWREPPFRELWSEEAVEASQLQQEYWRQVQQQVATVENQPHVRPVSPSMNLVNEIENALAPPLPSEPMQLSHQYCPVLTQQTQAQPVALTPLFWRNMEQHGALITQPQLHGQPHPQLRDYLRDMDHLMAGGEQQSQDQAVALVREHWQHVDPQVTAFATQMPPHLIPAPSPEYWRDLIAFPAQTEGPQVPQICCRVVEQKQDATNRLPVQTAITRGHWKDVDQLANNATTHIQAPTLELAAPLPLELGPQNAPQVAVFVPQPLPSTKLLLAPKPCEWRAIESNLPQEEAAQQVCGEQIRDSEQQAASSAEPQCSVQQDECQPTSHSEWLPKSKLQKVTATAEPLVRTGPSHSNFWPETAQGSPLVQPVFFTRKYWQTLNQKSSVQPTGQPEQKVWGDVEQEETGSATQSHLQSETGHREWWQAAAFTPHQGQALVHSIQPVNSVQSVQPVQSAKPVQPASAKIPAQSCNVETRDNWVPYAYASTQENSDSVPTEASITLNSVQKHTQEEQTNQGTASQTPFNCTDTPDASTDYPSFEEFARQVSECSLSSSEYIATLRNLMIRAHNLMLPLLRGRFANMSQVQMAAYTTAILEVTPLHPSLFLPSNVSRPWMGNGGLLPPSHPHSLTPQDLARIAPRPVLVHTGTQTEYHCWCMHISMFPPPPLPRPPGNVATHFAAANGPRMISPCSTAPLSFWGRPMVPMPHPHTHPYVHAHPLQRPHGSRYGYRINTYSVPCRFTSTGNGRTRSQLNTMCGATLTPMQGAPVEGSSSIDTVNSSLPVQPGPSHANIEPQHVQLQQQQQQPLNLLQRVASSLSPRGTPRVPSADLIFSQTKSNDNTNRDNASDKNINESNKISKDHLNRNTESPTAPNDRPKSLKENVAQRTSQDPLNEQPQLPELVHGDNSNEPSGEKTSVKRFHNLFLQPTGPVMPSMPMVHYYSGTLAQRGRQSELPHMIYDMNNGYSENAHYFQFLPNVNMNMNMTNSMPEVRVAPTDLPDNDRPLMPETISSVLMPTAATFKPNNEVCNVHENNLNENLSTASPNLLNTPTENTNSIPNTTNDNDFLLPNDENLNGFISSEEFTNGNITISSDHPTTECKSIKKFLAASKSEKS